MKRIDIIVPIGGWSPWYSTGAIVSINESKINIPIRFINQDLGLDGPISYEIIYWEDGKQKILTGYYLGDEELSIPVGGSDSISNISFRLKSTLGQHVIAYCTLDMYIVSNPEEINLADSNILPIDTISKIKDQFETAEEVRSPLVVDLDGDGVETVTAEGGVYFDHDANGFKENSGWVGQDDGILVRDINGNGIIDNGTELFGNNSVLSSGEKAVNGFEALKDLDDNNDGIFDRNDSAWNEVKVWQDKNFNANYSNIKPANPVFA